VLSPRSTALRRGDVARLAARGIKIVPWTVNEPAEMKKLIRWGVHGIITDRPDTLLALLGRRARRAGAAGP